MLKMSLHDARRLQLKCILTTTIVDLCQTALAFDTELRIDGLLGITVDKTDVFLVSISENYLHARTTDISRQTRTPSSVLFENLPQSEQHQGQSSSLQQRQQQARGQLLQGLQELEKPANQFNSTISADDDNYLVLKAEPEDAEMEISSHHLYGASLEEYKNEFYDRNLNGFVKQQSHLDTDVGNSVGTSTSWGGHAEANSSYSMPIKRHSKLKAMSKNKHSRNRKWPTICVCPNCPQKFTRLHCLKMHLLKVHSLVPVSRRENGPNPYYIGCTLREATPDDWNGNVDDAGKSNQSAHSISASTVDEKMDFQELSLCQRPGNCRKRIGRTKKDQIKTKSVKVEVVLKTIAGQTDSSMKNKVDQDDMLSVESNKFSPSKETLNTFACPECSYQFRRLNDVKDHLLRKHRLVPLHFKKEGRNPYYEGCPLREATTEEFNRRVKKAISNIELSGAVSESSENFQIRKTSKVKSLNTPESRLVSDEKEEDPGVKDIFAQKLPCDENLNGNAREISSQENESKNEASSSSTKRPGHIKCPKCPRMYLNFKSLRCHLCRFHKIIPENTEYGMDYEYANIKLPTISDC